MILFICKFFIYDNYICKYQEYIYVIDSLYNLYFYHFLLLTILCPILNLMKKY